MALSTTQENALRAWVVTASGYTEDQVIWLHQNGVRPTGDVITLKLGDDIALGAFDSIEEKQDLNRPAGQEIELALQGPREFVLTVQAFTSDTVNATKARSILSTVQLKARFDSIRDALKELDVSLFDLGRVQYVPAINNTDFEGRAVLEVRGYYVDTASEFTGYVTSVEVNGSLLGQAAITSSSTNKVEVITP